jgi:ubiquinol-cytochrome c reductase cytochrome b subunit
MNKLGSAGRAVPGTLLSPDPADETAALERAHTNGHRNGAVEGAEKSDEVSSGSTKWEH